jgi:hypothetical protein
VIELDGGFGQKEKGFLFAEGGVMENGTITKNSFVATLH